MLQPEDLEKCYFIPINIIKKVLSIIESPDAFPTPSNLCRRNLATLQASRSTRKVQDVSLVPHGWKEVHQMAVHKAIYSQNWNKLLYLLKKCPSWEHKFELISQSAIYFRALTILLMYHPTSQAQGLFNDYLHMVWSCRTDEDKKAIQKIILSLPKKIYGKIDKHKYRDRNNL